MNDRGVGVWVLAARTHPSSYYFFCEVVILVSVRTFFPQLLPVVPRPAPEATPSVQLVPGSVAEAVAEINPEQLPVSSAKCQCVMNYSSFLPPNIFVILQIWCDFDRASSLIFGNKMPTRCNRGFLLQILSLAQRVSGTTMPIIRSSRVLYSGRCLWYFVLWFSSCWSGVELRIMCAAASCKPDT